MKGNSTTKFIGLDVHSKTISVAIADEGRKGEVRVKSGLFFIQHIHCT